MSETIDYTKTCFVIMPFGEKPVGDKTIDFDDIYDRIFEPAIRGTELPEGGQLVPRRTDRDFFSGDISIEMFHYLEYSRIALADITGLNANVFYELGARHRARETGTAIFRQTDAPIPFDINKIKAFPYEYQPEDEAEKSRAEIMRILRDSLAQNRLDSPVQIALKVQQQGPGDAQALLHDAENAIRNQDRATAILKYRQAVQVDGGNPLLRMKLGLMLKDQGSWQEALDQFTAAVTYSPNYAEAHREKGIAENKLFHQRGRAAGASDGSAALRRAIGLNPQDFDALSSLGGILKRNGDFDAAREMYREATRVSNGHPYPLLNELKLHARTTGELPLAQRRLALGRAERALRSQVGSQPPYNVPWSFFDLAEIRLYCGDRGEFLQYLQQGLETSEHDWQPQTFRDSLQLLVDGGVHLAGLKEGLEILDQGIAELRG